MTCSPVVMVDGGVKVTIRLTPKAGANRIDGVAVDADGRAMLKVSVTAVPEDGKANAALIKLLAKEWRVPRTSIEVILGATDRRKVLFISGDAEELRHRLDTRGAK
jgi:uncharacterized protein